MNDVNNSNALAQSPLVPLWPMGAPGAVGDGPLDQPAISVHLPDPATRTGAGVVVCPGGGYRILASDHEGLQVARYLNRHGIAAFVLRYRLGERYSSAISLADGQRAVRWVRSRADQFQIAANRIGMLGFSAGGHLTTAVGVNDGSGNPVATDLIDRISARPDFLVPVYAVVNGELRGRKANEYTPTEVLVTAATPPAFIVHTHEDMIVPANQSLIFYDALRKAGVQAELHVFGRGEHGLGLGVGDPDLFEWPRLMVRWLRRSGYLTAKERISIVGRVLLNGEAPGMAWITLVPDDPNAPIARTRIGGDARGRFQIGAAVGPTAGPHRLVVHHISERQAQAGDGAYTLDDAVRYERFVDLVDGMEIVWDIGPSLHTP